MASKLGLQDFAAKHSPRAGTTPWITTIPEWPEIQEAWRNGVRTSAIRAWLVEVHGYDPALLTDGKFNVLRNTPR